MLLQFPKSQSLQTLSQDGKLLFATRMVRLFAYGFLSVILVIYLTQIGLTKTQIGLLLTFTLVGDAMISLWMTTAADSFGRKRTLIIGSLLMIFAGIVFALTNNFIVLIMAATIGVISPSGYEIGPFLAVEQAALSHIVTEKMRTRIFAWYHLAGMLASALGALVSGVLIQFLQTIGTAPTASYRIVVSGYALMGLILWILFLKLSPKAEVETKTKINNFFALLDKNFGLHRSKKTVLKLSLLFSMDSFAGGFILNSIVAFWFYIRFGVPPAVLGSIFFGASLFSGLSALAAARLASRIGLINTMVFTHLPSNILLMLVPLMPNVRLAIALFLIRCSISQMDVPTRQSYTMAVVSPDERSAAGGITNMARTIGTSLAPMFTSLLLGHAALLSLSFVLAGGLKSIYDVALYFNFKTLKPPEENI